MSLKNEVYELLKHEGHSDQSVHNPHKTGSSKIELSDGAKKNVQTRVDELFESRDNKSYFDKEVQRANSDVKAHKTKLMRRMQELNQIESAMSQPMPAKLVSRYKAAHTMAKRDVDEAAEVVRRAEYKVKLINDKLNV